MKTKNTSSFVSGTVNAPCGVFQVFITKEPLFSRALGKMITITISIKTPGDQTDFELCALYDSFVQDVCEHCSILLDCLLDVNLDDFQKPDQYVVHISFGRNLNEMLKGIQSKYDEYVVLSLRRGEENSQLKENQIRIPVACIADKGKGIKFSILRNAILKNQAQGA